MTTVYLDGSFTDDAEARVLAGDGLLSGRGLFETFRARRGHVLALDSHLDRLRRGAQVLGMPLPRQAADLPAIVRELVDRLGLSDARVRLTVLAVPGGSSLLVQARAAADYPPSLYESGMAAVVSGIRRNETSPLSRIKSLNYLDNLLARQEAQAAGADTAILLNSRGDVAETSTANIFAAVEGVLVTPPIADGALPGVTRSVVLALARDAGIPVHEETLALSRLLSASEAFLTNAVMGVMPLVAIGDHAIATGRPGELTAELRRRYGALSP